MQRTCLPIFPAHIASLLGVVFLLSSIGCQKGDSAADSVVGDSGQPAAKEVVVASALVQPWPVTLRVQGSLLADENAVVGSKIAGRVETVSVDLGTIVKIGQPMVLLDQRELELLVAQAEAVRSSSA